MKPKTCVWDRVKKKLIYGTHSYDGSYCWEYTGTLNAGYGWTFVCLSEGKRINMLVHRLTYTLYKGDIPEGLHIDHLCRNRACCNPDHLEAVTQLENNIREKAANVTHCPHGHSYDDSNTYKQGNQRRCRTCLNKFPRKPRTHCPAGHEYTPENTYVRPNDTVKNCRECHKIRMMGNRNPSRKEV